jgi:uncharacterized protein (TIGR03790 family)
VQRRFPIARLRSVLTFVGLLVGTIAFPHSACAQGPDNVLVVINDASPASQRVGEYYIHKRAVPAANVVHLRTATTDEISPAVFVTSIETPIAAAIRKENLQDQILYIVLTKGLPLRVQGTAGPQGTVASVDSELTLLYRKMTGLAAPTAGRIANPYFLDKADIATARPFSHEQYDIYLVTRLDGFTAEDAMALVDRAAAAKKEGTFVLDEKDTLMNRTGDDWLDQAGERLKAMGLGDRVQLDRDVKPVRGVSDVIGYFAWGSNDPANRVRHVGITFAPGAIAATFVSTDARTFSEPPADWQPLSNWNDQTTWFAGSPQSLTGDLIHDGVTGAAGHVAEPYLDGTERPQILLPAYAAGFNLAEAFYLALPNVSWQAIVVGDPLCRPFPGKTLPVAVAKPPVDASTDLPTFFSKRRLEVTRAQLRTDNMENVARVVRADARLARGDRTGARVDMEAAVKADPSLTAVEFQLAQLDDADGKHDAAIERYRRVVAQDPKHVLALNNLAYGLAIYQNAAKEARPLAERAAALAPRDGAVLDTLAWIQHLDNDNASASKTIVNAVNALPGNAEVRMHAAFIYTDAGAVAAAKFELQQIAKIDPAMMQRDDVKALQRRLESR